ncbi:hypothetical protein GGX14DRAFT_624138, partial [Mycena pura]
SLPVLPPEIWCTIIAFVTRLNGRCSTYLEDPFVPPYTTESSSVEDPSMHQDRVSILSVCRAWRAMASSIIFEFLRIRSIPQLRALVNRLEEGYGRDESISLPGEWVQRIDFKIAEPLTASPDLIPRLLRRTPNLMIYVNQNGSDYRPETQTPSSVMAALAEFCGPSLRRLEWSHVGEAPTWHDLTTVCHHAPNLSTLRLTWIYSYDKPYKAKLALPFLETLSLGLIPDPIDNMHIPVSWDPLLEYFSSDPAMLPSLRRFEIDLFPTSLHFFAVHSLKIRSFRTTNWSAPPILTWVLPLLPNLDTLVLTQSTAYATLPPSHPTLRRICIAPFAEEQTSVVPPRFFSSAVLGPLDRVLLSIDSTHLPRLEEIRIRNIGILKSLAGEPAWLLKWAKRWRFKGGVKFCDVHGRPFEEYPDPDNEPLLDAVRG